MIISEENAAAAARTESRANELAQIINELKKLPRLSLDTDLSKIVSND